MTDTAFAFPRYTRLEDLQGLLIASIEAAFGLMLLGAAGLVTGGTAGLALLISHLSGFGFGVMFFAVNLPFYWFAYSRKGMAFTCKTFLSVTAVSVMVELLPLWVNFSYLHFAVAAVLCGVITGVGVLGLFRHGSSLGGVGIVAVIVQERFGIRAGWVQMAWDLTLFAVAAFLLPAELVIWSLVGAVVLNIVIALNHRKDWYLPG